MHIDDVRSILRKKLKREPTYDDIATALNGTGWMEMKKEIEAKGETREQAVKNPVKRSR